MTRLWPGLLEVRLVPLPDPSPRGDIIHSHQLRLGYLDFILYFSSISEYPLASQHLLPALGHPPPRAAFPVLINFCTCGTSGKIGRAHV